MGDWSELPRPSYNCEMITVLWLSQIKGKRGGEIAHQTPFAPCWHGSTSWSLGPKKLPNVNFKYLHMETTRAQGTLLSTVNNFNVWVHWGLHPCRAHSGPIPSALVGFRQLHDICQVHVVSLQQLGDQSHGLSATPQLGVTSLDCPTVQGGMPPNGDDCLLLNWYPNYNSPGVDTIMVIQIDPNLWWFNTERRTKGQWKDA